MDHKEVSNVTASTESTESPGGALMIDPAIEKTVIRKCDIRVLLPAILLFALSFLDRVNIGNARIQGLTQDLEMTGTDFNVALLIFFIPFILMDVPSNILLKKLKPSTWLSVLLFFCGVMNLSMGLVRTKGELYAVRFLLGLFESGTGPGSLYLISMYYKRYELPWRLSWWYQASIIAGAFGGLLAYAIAHMDGLQGYSGWRWIFIIEGSVTAAVGVLMKWMIVDFPEDATFLKEEERTVLRARLSQDQTETAKMDRWDTRRIMSDWKIYLGMLMFFGIVNTNYATAFFIPTILVQLGHRATQAQLYTIPLYALASVLCLSTSYLSSRLKHRYLFILLSTFICICAEILLLMPQPSPGVKYFALFLIVGSGYVIQPLVCAWLLNNVGGHYKRSYASAVQVGWGNAGGIVASTVFFADEAPRYPTGYGVSIGLLGLTCLASTVMLILLIHENKIRRAGKRDNRLLEPGADNLGDDDPRFRFTY